MMEIENINYNEQMLEYYPEIIKAIREFQVLIETQSIQVEDIHEELTKALTNAYIIDCDEDTIAKWERFLGITPSPQAGDTEQWLEDRRETILARLYKSQKLSRTSISNLVHIFTEGTANSYFKDGVIHVEIYPPKNNKLFDFDNVKQEIAKKIPAHLRLEINPNYFTWTQINNLNQSWQEVSDNYETWEHVYLFVPVDERT